MITTYFSNLPKIEFEGKTSKNPNGEYPSEIILGYGELISHPYYMHGASTSPDPRIFAQATAQVKKALEVTKELGGENYVFWGGREGYETLLNTNMGIGPAPILVDCHPLS